MTIQELFLNAIIKTYKELVGQGVMAKQDDPKLFKMITGNISLKDTMEILRQYRKTQAS